MIDTLPIYNHKRALPSEPVQQRKFTDYDGWYASLTIHKTLFDNKRSPLAFAITVEICAGIDQSYISKLNLNRPCRAARIQADFLGFNFHL